ncbi:hypothetical protein Patl1_09994 [Pistacia atlantica]|uniref:Uncharacterized protein n=1 Tax=Pistacia atlantica TaxID=434234 RepID=A0ACC1A6R9_9ROSI|nr:hypothetical protein Patl1_09994 [Pistacia atlantica]
MADVVQYRMERMVDELDDLERRGLFTRREIQRNQYETQLDTLRRLRKKSVPRETEDDEKAAKKKRKRTKKSASDFAGVARVLEIYRLAVMRFKGDIELWFRYLEFCRLRKNGRMKKVLAQVIRFHPKVPGVWIYAAAWEFDHNLNVTGARALMQNGLRARKVALGEDMGTLVRDRREADEKQWINENKDLFMPLEEEKGSVDESNVENMESKKKLDLFREQGLRVLQTIYSGAVEAIPSSFSLRQRIFEILEGTDLAQSEDMRKEILSDMKRDFSADPEYWDWLARLEMTDNKSKQEMSENIVLSQMQKAVQVYEEALENVPSAKMLDQYTKFLTDIITPNGGETKVSEPSSHIEHCISHLFTVYEKAEAMGCLTEDIACRYISLYLQLGRLDEARKLAEKLCSGTHSDSIQLWLLRVSIEVRCVSKNSASPSKADMLSIFELPKKVKIEALDVGSEYGFSLPSANINFVLQKDGIQHAREMYKRFLALPRPGLVLYRNCIELESNLASVGDKNSLVNALESCLNLLLQLMTKTRNCGEITILWRLSWGHQKQLPPSIGEHGRHLGTLLRLQFCQMHYNVAIDSRKPKHNFDLVVSHQF